MPERDSTLYLRDMLEFCGRVFEYTSGMDKGQFLEDRMRFDATLRNLELIGEAASRVPDDLRGKAPEIAWRQVIGTRNRLAHAYLTLDADTLWLLITGSVPQLGKQLEALLIRLGQAPA